MADIGVEQINTSAAPRPAGHYSQAIAAGDLLFIAGQLPHKPDGSRAEDASFEIQAERAIANLLAILEAGGGSRETLVRVSVYIVDIANWPIFDRIYAGMMGDARPARTVVPVPELHFGYAVEIDGIALRCAGAD